MESKEDNCKVRYLVLEKDRVKVVSADTDTVIAHGGIKASTCPFIHGED